MTASYAEMAELAGALDRVAVLKPPDCLRRVEEQFSPDKMARGYEQVYYALRG